MGDTVLDGTIASLRDFRRTLPSALHRPFDTAVALTVAGEFSVEIAASRVTFTAPGAFVRFGPLKATKATGRDNHG